MSRLTFSALAALAAVSCTVAAPPATALRANKPRMASKNKSIVQSGCTGTTFDYYLLVTQWDISECMDNYNCQSTAQWMTLHGLWPNDNNGNYPCYCTNEAFNQNDVSDLLTVMNQYWPSLNGANSDFWSHEWTKHGTCATTFSSQHDYFAAALAARTKYDVVAALTDAGFPPSNTQGFTQAEFDSALVAAFGQTGVQTCDSSGNILEVSLCLSKTLNPIACPSNVQNSCSASTLYLPSSMQ